MLDLMRKHAKSWLIKVALFAIVIVFIFWGGYSYTAKRASRLAVVNGSVIGIQEYQNMYNNMVQQLRQQFGKQFSQDMLEALNIKQEALNQLINKRLILGAAKKLDLDVSRQEIQQAITSYPAFQVNGRFDPSRYQMTLRYMRLTPQEFEASQYQDLLVNKVMQFIQRGAKVQESELKSFYHLNSDKIKLAYVEVEPRNFAKKVKLDEAALAQYFEQHQEAYRIPEKRKITYVRFSPKSYLDEVKPTESDIEAYYNLHLDLYVQPKMVHARHIVFRIPKKATAEQIKAITRRAEAVLKKARKGKDFAALAKKYSQDSTAAKGGDLGFFSRNDIAEPLADAAFSMSKGQVSDLVRTRFGLHIIKVEEIRESKTKSLAEVRSQVIKSLKEERASEIARDKAEAFSDEATALENLRQAAANSKLQPEESNLFSADEAIAGLGRYSQVNDLVFAAQLHDITPAIEAGRDFIVAQVTEIEDSRLPELAEVKGEVEKNWRREKSLELARQHAEQLLTEAQQQGSLQAVVGKKHLQLQQTDLFAFANPPAPLGNNRVLLLAAFALTPDKPLAKEVFKVGDRFLLIQLRDKKIASEEEYLKEKKELADRLLQTRRQQLLQRWLSALRQQSEIKILQKL